MRICHARLSKLGQLKGKDKCNETIEAIEREYLNPPFNTITLNFFLGYNISKKRRSCGSVFLRVGVSIG